MSDKYDMYVIVPGNQEHHNRIAPNLYIWSTKALQTKREDSWQFKTRLIATLASELNRGAVLSNDLPSLEALCLKYGGIIQDIRTGEVITLARVGWAFEKWIALGEPFHYDQITLVAGHAFVGGILVRNEFRTNGQQTMNYVKHLTDIPEVIHLLGRTTYIP